LIVVAVDNLVDLATQFFGDFGLLGLIIWFVTEEESWPPCGRIEMIVFFFL
jgi:hypothetical protein